MVVWRVFLDAGVVWRVFLDAGVLMDAEGTGVVVWRVFLVVTGVSVEDEGMEGTTTVPFSPLIFLRYSRNSCAFLFFSSMCLFILGGRPGGLIS